MFLRGNPAPALESDAEETEDRVAEDQATGKPARAEEEKASSELSPQSEGAVEVGSEEDVASRIELPTEEPQPEANREQERNLQTATPTGGVTAPPGPPPLPTEPAPAPEPPVPEDAAPPVAAPPATAPISEEPSGETPETAAEAPVESGAAAVEQPEAGEEAPAPSEVAAEAEASAEEAPREEPSPEDEAGAPASLPPARDGQPEVAEPAIDLTNLARRVPVLTPQIASIRSALDTRIAAVHQRAEQRQSVVAGSAEGARTSLHGSAEATIANVQTDTSNARSQLEATVVARAVQIDAENTAAAQSADAGVATESDRVATDSEALTEEVRSSAESKTEEANSLGETEAERARSQVAAQAAAARAAAENYASGLTDEEPERLESRRHAARDVGEQQALDIEDTADDVAEFALENAGSVGDQFVDQAEQVAAGIEEGAPQVQSSVLSISADAATNLATGAESAHAGLEELNTNASSQLDEMESTAVGQIGTLLAESLSQVSSLEQSVSAQVDAAAVESESALNSSVPATVESCLPERDGMPLRNPDETIQTGIVDQSTAALDEFATGFTTQVNDLDGSMRGGWGALRNQVGTGDAAAITAGESGGDDVASGFAEAAQGTVDTATQSASQIANDALSGFQQPVTDATLSFDNTIQDSRDEVRAGVQESLDHNQEAVDHVAQGAHEADVEAARQFDRSVWEKIGEALLKAVIFLALSLIALYLLAAVIFVVGLLLVKAGIIAGITFATALIIAGVVLAVTFIIVDLVDRVNRYREEHGPIDNFWEALGVAAGLVGLSILSITGIPQIIEGIRGKRFFSDREIPEQERFDMVVGGALQLILLGAGLITRGGRSGGGRRGGFFERINRSIERFLERTILGEKDPAGGGCFVAGTLVSTTSGPVAIERIRTGDTVVSCLPCSFERVESQVHTVFAREVNTVVELVVAGTRIVCSPEHPFWEVNAGWRHAGELVAGDELVDGNGVVHTVEVATRLKGEWTVYNIAVSEPNTYLVSDRHILVHNKAVRVIPGATVTRNGNAVSVYDTATGDLVGYGTLDGAGVIDLAIYTKDANTSLRGVDVFDAIWTKFINDGFAINGMRGSWISGDNLATFNNLISQGVAPEAAALQTFTGKMAVRNGFNNARVEPSSVRRPDGTYEKAFVTFY